jgi:hypothetical protein
MPPAGAVVVCPRQGPRREPLLKSAVQPKVTEKIPFNCEAQFHKFKNPNVDRPLSAHFSFSPKKARSASFFSCPKTEKVFPFEGKKKPGSSRKGTGHRSSTYHGGAQ